MSENLDDRIKSLLIESINNKESPEVKLRDPGDYSTERNAIFEQAEDAFRNMPPVSNSRFTLSVEDINWKDDPEYDNEDVVRALRKRESLDRTLTGRFILKDTETGEVVQKGGRKNLAHIPYFTDDGTFLIDGTEFGFTKQARLMPGVYTHNKAGGETVSQINPSQGGPFRILLGPEKRTFYIKEGNKHIPAYPVLKTLGFTDEQLKSSWGKELFNINSKQPLSKRVQSWIDEKAAQGKKIISRGSQKEDPDKSALQNGLQAWLMNKKINPGVAEETLGIRVDKVTPETLLKITESARAVHNDKKEEDNRDSLRYQEVYGFPDRLSEAIRRDKTGQMRNMLWNVTRKNDLKGLPSYPFDSYVSDLFVNSGNQQVLEQVNPLDMYNQATKITWLGEGGIPSTESAPGESRGIQPSYFGFIDLHRSPESARIGLDMYLSEGTKLGSDRKLYKKMINTKTGEKEWVDMRTAAKANVGFPSYYKKNRGKKYVDALAGETMDIIPREKVDYVLEEGDETSNAFARTIPMQSGVKGMRKLMGSKFLQHAVPLIEREKPYVSTQSSDGGTIERKLGELAGARKSPADGIVKNVSDTYIHISDSSGNEHKIPLYNHRPYARKSGIHNYPLVSAGDRVKKGDMLASSDYTDDEGDLAVIRNLRTAVMHGNGFTYEDAHVISQSAADKLRARLMMSPSYETDDEHTLSKREFVRTFPGKYTMEQLNNIGEDGALKPGAEVKYGDPIFLAVHNRPPDQSPLNRPLRTDASKTWKYDYPGKVVRSTPKENGHTVDIDTVFGTEEADKLSIPFGGKGVAARIKPDHSMPVDSQGRPIEVQLNPLSIASRANPSQLAAMALGKVAEKTGKRYVLPGTFEEAYDVSEDSDWQAP